MKYILSWAHSESFLCMYLYTSWWLKELNICLCFSFGHWAVANCTPGRNIYSTNFVPKWKTSARRLAFPYVKLPEQSGQKVHVHAYCSAGVRVQTWDLFVCLFVYVVGRWVLHYWVSPRTYPTSKTEGLSYLRIFDPPPPRKVCKNRNVQK